MDNSNWRPTQSGDSTIDPGNWRTQLQADSRQRIVNKIMDALKTHLPFSGQEGLQELKKIAVCFEERIYNTATNQSDYLRKIFLKMLTMETKSQNSMPNSLQTNSATTGKNTLDPGSQAMQSKVSTQGQPISISMPMNQVQAGQQFLSQSSHSNITSSGVQGPANVASGLPSGNGLSQNTMSNLVGPNSSLQNIENISGVPQNSVGNAMGQGVPSNSFGNQRQMQGRQQLAPQQQQQQQSQNPQHYLYLQQLQQQYVKHKLQQGNIPHPLLPPHIQQQTLLQPNQLQASQQSMMQPTLMQPSQLSSIQQNPQSAVQQSTQSVIQPHQQSVLRQPRAPQQGPVVHQQQAQVQQHSMLPLQQQQQPNSTNMQHSQLLGPQNNISELQQQQQQQQRMLSQQSLSSLPQQQQQQLIGQQNNLQNMHQQQLGPQQLHGRQGGNSNILSNQHTVHLLHSKVGVQQPNQQSSATLMAAQGQQSQQQIMSLLQSQPGQLLQSQPGQLALQQPNLLQWEMQQQRLQTSGPLLQQQNAIDPQKQLFQAQRIVPEAPSSSLDSTAQTGNPAAGDWQEEVYQKIKAMKEAYFPELSEMNQKMAAKLQQLESLPQQPKSDQLKKVKAFKTMLERILTLLKLSKSNIVIGYKDKLGAYEKQILGILSSHRPRKPVGALQQGQTLATTTHMHSIQQLQQTQSQIAQVQPNENHMNPSLHSINMQGGSVATLQQNSLQHGSVPLTGVPSAPQNMLLPLQPGSNLDSGLNGGVTSLQQNPVSGTQQVNMNLLSSHGGMNSLQSNVNSLQSGSNILQNQQMKQELMIQSQQLKQQFQHRQMQAQFMQKQQLLQQPQHQTNPQQQLQQLSDGNELKTRQQLSINPGAFPQHQSAGQRPVYHHHQQSKSGAQFPISSPRLQAASPQIPQDASPHVDQQNLLNSLTRSGTPLPSTNSPFVVPSPSTPLAPSPMPGEMEKVNSVVPGLSNAGNVGHPQPTGGGLSAQSLAIGTPGISASPLLAEFTAPDGNLANSAIVISGKSGAMEQPIERLLKVVKSMSPKALSASVSEIGSVVSMIDRIAGSAPGNGSRAAVGEDLVAMTKCRLQARNFIAQDGTSGTRKMKRFISAMPWNVVSSAGSVNDSFKRSTGWVASELESTATSSMKRVRIEPSPALREEIREINRQLIGTVVVISHEDVDPTAAVAASEGSDGIIVKCSFTAVALSPNLKAQYASAQMSPIQPLRLLVPSNYPNCSPILLDKFPVEVSKEYEDLSNNTKSRFCVSLRTLSQPMSLGEIARTWDACARAIICEHARQGGGGTFSSKYGRWEDCLSAA